MLSFKLVSHTMRKCKYIFIGVRNWLCAIRHKIEKCINDIFCDIDWDDCYTQTDNMYISNINLFRFLIRNIHVFIPPYRARKNIFSYISYILKFLIQNVYQGTNQEKVVLNLSYISLSRTDGSTNNFSCSKLATSLKYQI